MNRKIFKLAMAGTWAGGLFILLFYGVYAVMGWTGLKTLLEAFAISGATAWAVITLVEAKYGS
jgi:hypothetical protein